ncbi:MAG: hypothetical protein ACRDWI_06505 [Jiangellaceae bacterium]
MNGPEVTGAGEGAPVDQATVRPWDPALVNWEACCADWRELADECETTAAQIVAEARAEGRQLRLRDQEQRAALQAAADVCERLLGYAETWLSAHPR